MDRPPAGEGGGVVPLGARHSSGAIMIMTRHWSDAPPAEDPRTTRTARWRFAVSTSAQRTLRCLLPA
jgi:hypothetical protein